jgi:hypothetical protein
MPQGRSPAAAEPLTLLEGTDMKQSTIVCGALVAALGSTGCANMSSSQQSTLSGAGIGTAAGVAVGAITGDWAWAAAGAAIGAGAGYLTEQERQRQAAAQQKAFNEGVQAGKQQAAQKN